MALTTPALTQLKLFMTIEPTSYGICDAANILVNYLNNSAILFNTTAPSGAANFIGSYPVASLPAGGGTFGAGALAYASNGRKIAEGAGNGTGVLVYYSAGAWRAISSDYPVQT